MISLQGQLFVYFTETGQLCFKIPLKPETNVKDVTNIVSVTQKPYFVALLEGRACSLLLYEPISINEVVFDNVPQCNKEEVIKRFIER